MDHFNDDDDFRDPAALSPVTQLCGTSATIDGAVEAREAGATTLAGTSVTDSDGNFCVDARRPTNEFEICVGEGVYRARGGETYPLVDDSQRSCTEWFGTGAVGEPPSGPLHISWRSHARYLRYRYLLTEGQTPREAHAIADAEFAQWVGRRVGRSVADAAPLDPQQDYDEPPTMTAELVAWWLDETWDTVWPQRLNKQIYKGSAVVTPPLLSAIMLDGDLAADGAWDSYGEGGAPLTLPDSDHELDAHTMRGGVNGYTEALVWLLRDSDRNPTGYKDTLPLVQEMSLASGGYFPGDGGRVYDLEGPANPASNMTPTTVVQQQFELVAQLADAVPIRSAGLVVPADACYSVTGDSDALRCADDRRTCTLTLGVDAAQCGYVTETLELESIDGHGNTSLHRFVVLINPDPPRLIVDTAPKDETVPAFGANFAVSGHCVSDDHIIIESTSVEIIDADGVAITAAVGANKCAQVPGCFDFPVDVAELATDKYTVRVSCIDVRGVAADDYSHPVEIDLTNPTGEINLVIPEDRLTRVNDHGTLEVGGTELGGYVDVAGKFGDVGTGVEAVVLTVDGESMLDREDVAMTYDLAAGTFEGRVPIKCNQGRNVVLSLQVFDGVDRVNIPSEQELRCDAYAPNGTLHNTYVIQERGIVVSLGENNSLVYDASSAEVVLIGPDTVWPLHVSKYSNRGDFLPKYGRDVRTQNLMELIFTVSDAEKASANGVFVLDSQIDVEYRFLVAGEEKRAWTPLSPVAGQYRLPFSYQTLHQDMGRVDKDTQLLVEVRLFDGLHYRTYEFDFYMTLLHPPVFCHNCEISVVEKELDGEILKKSYTRHDDNVPFLRCSIARVLDLPPESLAPTDDLMVDIDDDGLEAELRSPEVFEEKRFVGQYELFCTEDCSCPYGSMEFAHRLDGYENDDHQWCFFDKYAHHYSRAWLRADHAVSGNLMNDKIALDQDAETLLWSLPVGTYSLVVTSARPRARVHWRLPAFPGTVVEDDYDWEEFWSEELEDVAYTLGRHDGYDLHETSVGVSARDWFVNAFLEQLSLTVPIPGLRITHPVYGEVETARETNKAELTVTMQE